jgi:hypothetical protein
MAKRKRGRWLVSNVSCFSLLPLNRDGQTTRKDRPIEGQSGANNSRFGATGQYEAGELAFQAFKSTFKGANVE